MKPRRSRWLSIAEVVVRLIERDPRLAARPRKRQLECARRLVRRVERRDSTRLTRRAGRELFVNVDALSSLLPIDVARLHGIDASLADLHQRHRQLERRVNGHGSKIRELEGEVVKGKEVQSATTDAIAAFQRLLTVQGRT